MRHPVRSLKQRFLEYGFGETLSCAYTNFSWVGELIRFPHVGFLGLVLRLLRNCLKRSMGFWGPCRMFSLPEMPAQPGSTCRSSGLAAHGRLESMFPVPQLCLRTNAGPVVQRGSLTSLACEKGPEQQDETDTHNHALRPCFREPLKPT